jgi:hypothetical protein
VIFRFGVLLASVLLVSGCGELPPPDPGPSVATVYVVQRGWHTDIGLAAGAGLGPLRAFEREFPGARFFVFGFGEREYLEARATTPWLLLRALFPSEGLVLVTALSASPVEAFAGYRVVARPVSREGLARLTGFIAGSVEWAPDGRPRLAARGPYDGSLFYASPLTYDLVDTCNTWTARGLHAAGLPVSAEGVVSEAQVLDQLAP